MTYVGKVLFQRWERERIHKIKGRQQRGRDKSLLMTNKLKRGISPIWNKEDHTGIKQIIIGNLRVQSVLVAGYSTWSLSTNQECTPFMIW